MLSIRLLLHVILELLRNFFRGIRSGLISYSAAIMIKFVSAKKTMITMLMGVLLWMENFVLLNQES